MEEDEEMKTTFLGVDEKLVREVEKTVKWVMDHDKIIRKQRIANYVYNFLQEEKYNEDIAWAISANDLWDEGFASLDDNKFMSFQYKGFKIYVVGYDKKK